MCKFRYKHYLLILLTIVATFNYLDRYVLSLAMESIKQDFNLSDSELGFLTGFAFASFYAVAGVPLARWADRGNRNTIITITTGIWSAMVAICGLATSFIQLLLIRIGVAVGEAGCVPPANSLISDYFDRAERPRAMSIYYMSGAFALIGGYLGGGWLIEHVGWQHTFIIIGMPGIILALIVRFTLREPRLIKKNTVESRVVSFSTVLSTIINRPSLLKIIIAFSFAYFFGMGFSQWMPAFFMRSYGMDAGEVGQWFALIWGGLGLIGMYLGGYLAERYAPCNESLQLRCVALSFVISSVFYLLVFLAEDKLHAMLCMAVAGTISVMSNGPIFSAIQSLVGEKIRAVALALVFLIANFIGLGLGPLAVGALSDVLVNTLGQESLRYALAAFTPGLAFVGFFYWRASKTIEADILEAESSPGYAEQHSTGHSTIMGENKTGTADV